MQAVVLGSVASLKRALQQPLASLSIQMCTSGALSFPEASAQAGESCSTGKISSKSHKWEGQRVFISRSSKRCMLGTQNDLCLFSSNLYGALIISIHAGGRQGMESSVAAASAWGLLRNAFQEYPAPKFAGLETDPLTAVAGYQKPADSFGVALSAGLLCQPRMLPKARTATDSSKLAFSGQEWAITGVIFAFIYGIHALLRSDCMTWATECVICNAQCLFLTQEDACRIV